MKKFIKTISFVIIISIMLCFNVSAASGDSFSRIDKADNTEATVLSRAMYSADSYITGNSVGFSESFDGLTDICYGNNDEVYILCGLNSRLIKLNADYTLCQEINVLDKTGTKIDYSGAKGIYVDDNEKIYIADTTNGRVIITDQNGNVLDIWSVPDSEMVPEDFVYQPTSVVCDEQGYTYILSLGCYYGALTYSPENEFKGFYGANTVTASALDTLEFLWDKLTGNDTKRSMSSKKLPYSFVDFSLDKDGYMVICTGTTDGTSNGLGQIRKISPGGSDILYSSEQSGKSILSSTINFLEEEVIKRNNQSYPQNLVSIAVDKSGFIYAADKTYGLIYIYDDGCNLLGAFGGGSGVGNKLGLFSTVESIAVNDDTILVADSKNRAISVFKTTEYGKALKNAQNLYLQGQYKEAEPYWQEVLRLDNGNQLAYKGMAMINYIAGNNDVAMEYAEKGLDYSTYNLAYQSKLTSSIKANFTVITIFVILVLGALIALFVVTKKNNKVLIKNQTISTCLGCVFHPFISFNDVKYKNKGSKLCASIILLLFFVFTILNETASGFLFSNYSADSYNILYSVIMTVGLVLLWSVANWLVSVLFSGKGKLEEIYVVSCYSLIPIVLFKLVRFILTYFLPYSGMAVMDGIYVAILIYTFFILSVAIMTVQDYGFGKFIGTGLLTLFGMLLVVFVLFMIIIQMQQLWIFICSLFMEVVYR